MKVLVTGYLKVEYRADGAVNENYTSRSGTHNFLLTFRSNRRPISHRFRDKRQFPSKIANFPTPCIYSPDEGVPLGIWIGVRGPKCLNDGATRWSKSFKIGLVVLIQYRLWQTPTQPASHVAVASTRYAYLRRAVKSWSFFSRLLL